MHLRSTAGFHNVDADRRFVDEMRSVLASWKRAKRMDNQKRQAVRISALLQVATPPIPNVDAHFATASEAEKLVAPNVFFNGPIFTENQQSLPLQTVDQFLAEFYDDNVLADIQDPAMKITPCTRRVRISQVKARLLKPKKPNEKPWNLLEIATHADEGIKPSWLNREDCRLITKLKIPEAQKTVQRRGYLPGYKEVERWALVAQAGALTNPHQDSHGYSTFITCNQGEIGFGWLSHPTAEERAGWERSSDDYIGGRWRYIVIRPGQTVYFPAGTVHFIFRLPSKGNTLAFGGHVLRCSNLVHWIKTLLAEKRADNISNEDLSASAPGYLDTVETFLNQAQKQGKAGKWGGMGAIKEFLRLKAEFMAT
ncbi:hypothetical protein K431DRAFT_226194 [Polychaeton citri CBS 116435]|uniref:JmjC domain-containing protein n=1 Tax=Polychaeton citri CBS 116435 TaxID=1314669 RepID=A0A9P4UND4_9PEZI|nr:hypothetical protein K431DRAFT_226194 [Polychaeton citri CBS 116435]